MRLHSLVMTAISLRAYPILIIPDTQPLVRAFACDNLLSLGTTSNVFQGVFVYLVFRYNYQKTLTDNYFNH